VKRGSEAPHAIAVATAPAPAPASAPAPAVAPVPAAAPVQSADDAADLERRLARVKPEQSLRASIETVLAAWHVAGLRADEKVMPESLEGIVHGRGLEDLRLTGNLSMLRLLDLPAILEIRLAGNRESSYVVLTRIGDDEVVLSAGAETMRVPPRALDRVWFGDAHVVWRDFEWLGPTFGTEAKGAHVARLQRALSRAGLYSGPATGTFDAPTQTAVVGFQRSRRLDPDSRVGRLTRIALYGAASGYQVPRLAGAARANSGAARDSAGAARDGTGDGRDSAVDAAARPGGGTS